MAYNPTPWHVGDVVTSQRLNQIEEQLEAISNEGIITVDGQYITASFQDIEGWINNGVPVILFDVDTYYVMRIASLKNGNYQVSFGDGNITASSDDYESPMTIHVTP